MSLLWTEHSLLAILLSLAVLTTIQNILVSDIVYSGKSIINLCIFAFLNCRNGPNNVYWQSYVFVASRKFVGCAVLSSCWTKHRLSVAL
jgi:hypothetical protein